MIQEYLYHNMLWLTFWGERDKNLTRTAVLGGSFKILTSMMTTSDKYSEKIN